MQTRLRALIVLVVLVSVLFPADALLAGDDAEPTAALQSWIEYGECEYFNGRCYRPMKMQLAGDPALLARKAAEPGEGPVVIWRIRPDTGEEDRFEFDIDHLQLPTFIPEEMVTGEGGRSGERDTNRTKITNTAQFPYSSVLKLFMSIPDQPYGAACSGMVFGAAQVALTAGHCGYNNDPNEGPVGYFDIDYIIPAMNGQHDYPFGYTTASELWIPDEWKNPSGGEEFNHDWCIIRMARAVGQDTGWMGIVATSRPNSYFYGETIHVLGYPGDLDGGLRMYHVQGVVEFIWSNVIYHDAYVYYGNSGGPSYFVLNGRETSYEIVGIVSHGVEYDGHDYTGSVKINSAIMAAKNEAQNCTPNCAGKECGPDGCGGDCGSCGKNGSCTQNGKCKCNYEECKDVCCDAGEVCSQVNGRCCLPDCAGRECGWNGCGGDCGECGPNAYCTLAGECKCSPDHVECGDECCAEGDICHKGACCAASCEDRDCGSDGCGGSCGACGRNEVCEAGACECEYESCGGECCGSEEVCFNDACCLPDCEGKECGSDACGGDCGACGANESCVKGTCLPGGGPDGDEPVEPDGDEPPHPADGDGSVGPDGDGSPGADGDASAWFGGDGTFGAGGDGEADSEAPWEANPGGGAAASPFDFGDDDGGCRGEGGPAPALFLLGVLGLLGRLLRQREKLVRYNPKLNS